MGGRGREPFFVPAGLLRCVSYFCHAEPWSGAAKNFPFSTAMGHGDFGVDVRAGEERHGSSMQRYPEAPHEGSIALCFLPVVESFDNVL